MVSQLDLNGTWRARGFDGQHGVAEGYVKPDADERIFFDAQVPGDIHLDLQRLGLVEDANIGLNAQNQRWVEEQVWVYRRTFEAPAEAVKQHAWIVFEALDLCADIYLNGEKLCCHANVFVPCRVDVTGKLQEGTNTLAVRIEGGLYSVADKPCRDYNCSVDHALHKRSWLRKPQCQFSWDWSPRLVNVGMPKNVYLEWCEDARIDTLSVYSLLKQAETGGNVATMVVRAWVDNVNAGAAHATLRLRIPEAGKTIEQPVELPEGESKHEIQVEIEEPKLWWPRAHGDQPLYTVECELEMDGKVVDSARRRTGIRSVEIKQDPHPDGGRYFIIEVNGRPIFCKGGNWVPPDIIYSRIDDERYRKLVELAVDANCNCLRIWGGGLYADQALLEACDELGVMVWHDFIFACSKYPSDNPEFLGSVRAEIRHQVRRVSPHPSLIVWCGNNELEWGAWGWGYDRDRAWPDYALYHLEMPRILSQEDPSRPYWPSSPYSLDMKYPNDRTTGDQHPWQVSLGDEGANFWWYRTDFSRFPNEGGVLGATGLATLKQFLPEDQRQVYSPVWEFHDNACNYGQPAGVCYKGVYEWLGLKPEDVSFEEYAFLSGLLQAEGLCEYINNYRRRMFSSSSAIFWMYNDTWPASHGWTIVDYYLRRKLAYHPVRRAFQPITAVLAVEGDKIRIFGINDTPDAWAGEARFGLFKLAGGLPVDRTVAVSLPPNASTVIGEVAVSDIGKHGLEKAGAFALLMSDGEVVAQNRLFLAKFKDLKWAKPEIRVERRGDKVALSSEAFAWGACLDPECDSPVADDVFDLIPGMEYLVDWPAERPLPTVRRTGSG